MNMVNSSCMPLVAPRLGHKFGGCLVEEIRATEELLRLFCKLICISDLDNLKTCSRLVST